jgi:CcmD family protein
MKHALFAIALLLTTTVAAPAVFAQETGPKPYVSPMQAECRAELEKDATLRAFCKDLWTAELHERDAANATTNKKHVVLAYAAIWIITMVFLVMMWLRQSKLKLEIDRLEKDLAKALEND